MRTKYIFIGFVLIFLVVTAIYNFILLNNKKNIDPQSKEPKIVLPINQQPNQERKIKSVKLKFLKTIDLEKIKIYQPVKIRVVDSKSIYILDLSVPAVKKIDIEKSDIKKYGAGKGQGPGELLNPTDFFVDKNQNVWIIDGALNSLSKFNYKGNFEFSIKPKSLVYRVLISSNDKIFLISSSNEYLFLKFNQKAYEKSFGKIIDNQEKLSILLSGNPTIDHKDNLYFVSDRGDLFLSYDSDGKLRFATNTITGKDLLPKPKIMKEDIIVLPNQLTNLDISYHKDNVYILSKSDIKQKSECLIDVYQDDNGLYRYSINVPNKIFSFAIYSDTLFLLDEFNVYVYKIV